MTLGCNKLVQVGWAAKNSIDIDSFLYETTSSAKVLNEIINTT